MIVRQHIGCGRLPGPEASGFSPVRFLSVGTAAVRKVVVEISATVVWQKPNPFAQAALASNFSCGT
jgi:hypothetical protein